MFRNQYDNDVTVWSPQGRIHQMEYAMEAVKQGSATIGIKNNDYALLLAFNRASSELSAFQKKIIPIDDHVGVAIAGLTADGRILSRHMRLECMNYKYSYNEYHPINTLITNVSRKMQMCTQRYDRRPFGVGLIFAGYGAQGPIIVQMCPSANYFECKAMAIGSRSQSARTYMDKNLDSFSTCSLDELLKHGIKALRDTMPVEVELNEKNVTLSIVGKDKPFSVLSESEIVKILNDIGTLEVRRSVASLSQITSEPSDTENTGDSEPLTKMEVD